MKNKIYKYCSLTPDIYTKPLPTGMSINGKPLKLLFGNGQGKQSGRLFGMGFSFNSGKGLPNDHQVLRMDHHDSHGAKDEVLADTVNKYSFHYHILPPPN